MWDSLTFKADQQIKYLSSSSFFNLEDISPFVRPLIQVWTSGDVCPAYLSKSNLDFV